MRGPRADLALYAGLLTAFAIVILQVSMGPAIVGISVAVAIGYLSWLFAFGARVPPTGRRVLRLYALGFALHCVHAFEEVRTGLQRELPSLAGYEWSTLRFSVFNVAVLALFAAGWVALRRGVQLAHLLAWILAVVVGIGNGAFHLVVVADRAGYFPGAWTALPHLVVGTLLARALLAERRGGDSSSARAPSPS